MQALVDEHYISRVIAGLTAYYPTDDKTYKLIVKKVLQLVQAAVQSGLLFVAKLLG